MQNLSPGAADRLGLSAENLHPDFPRLIVCDISGYGDKGPHRNKKAYDHLIQSEAGLLSVTGTPEIPSKAGISIADISAGMYAFSGILAALLQRERTGKGTRIQDPGAIAPCHFFGLRGVHGPGSRAGRTSGAILSELGYSQDEIARMREAMDI